MPDYGPLVIGVCLSATAVSGLFLTLRLYCKVDRSRGLWWDDYVLIAAWICLAVAAGLAVYDVTLGFGQNVSEVSLSNRQQTGLVGTLIGLFAVCAAAWSKTSFAMTLLRLSLSRGWMTRLLWVLIISMNIIMGLVIVFSFVKCSPTAKVWDRNRPGRCWDARVATYYNIFAGAYSGAMDLVLCVLAWVIIWKLQVSAKEKIGVGIALTFGVFAAATAAVKCYRMLQLSSPNPTVAGVGIITWGLVESAVTIMAASIPMMRVLALKWLHDEAERRSSSGSRSRKVRSRSNKRSSDTSGGPILPRRDERDDDVCCVGGDTVYELDQPSFHELTGDYAPRDSRPCLLLLQTSETSSCFRRLTFCNNLLLMLPHACRASDFALLQLFEEVSSFFLSNFHQNPDFWREPCAPTGPTRKLGASGTNLPATGTNVVTWAFVPLLLKSAEPRLLLVAGLSQITQAAEKYFPTPPQPAGWPKKVDFETIGYRCSKTALSMLMLDWNHKLKEDGVKVFSVSPGFCATGLGGVGEELIQAMGGEHPSKEAKRLLDVAEGNRDADAGRIVDNVGLLPWKLVAGI